MADDPGSPEDPDDLADAGRPDPAPARTPAEFVEALRRLKRWTGRGYRQLEKRANAAGHALPRSTLTVALSRDALPREDLVEAFVRACGCDDGETARWLAARRRIASAPSDASPGVAPGMVSGVLSGVVSGVLSGPVSGLVPHPGAPAPNGVPTPNGTPAQNGARDRRRVHTGVVVAFFAVVVVAAAYLLEPPGRGEAQGDPDQGSPAPSSAAQDPPAPPTSWSATGAPAADEPPPVVVTATAALPAPPVPAPREQVDRAPRPTGQPTPQPAPPPRPAPSTGRTTTPVATASRTITLPGEPAIHCPMPYLSTAYGPLAQCTQRSGGRARPGYYSPVTGQFEPTLDWVSLVHDEWRDDPTPSLDGVTARACGYAALETPYGPGVWSTQYRGGQARWGIVNLVDGRFQPTDHGWLATVP
ncbi:hypothetical protein [Saccharothrix xinjiangensis]|uniref:Helix-turn-helix protein n=1 Tax=Saccharothrix xinjiangensis TaxID=204798 RepID=A0ABV9Y9X2_9PSEU